MGERASVILFSWIPHHTQMQTFCREEHLSKFQSNLISFCHLSESRFLGDVNRSQSILASTSMEVEEEVKRMVEEVKELHDSAASFISSSSHQELTLRQKATSVEASLRRLHSTLASDKSLDPKLVEKAFFWISLSLSLSSLSNLVSCLLIDSLRRICTVLDACSLMEISLPFSHPNPKVSFKFSYFDLGVSSWPILIGAGRFVRMFLGPVNVRASRKDIQLKVKEEYNSYRVSVFCPLHVAAMLISSQPYCCFYLSMEQDKTALLFLFFPAALMILRSYYWDGCLPAFPVQLYEV